jgi:phage/plasmid-associated DNA primase
MWIEECCIRDATAWTSSKKLFASWKSFAEQAGEFVGSAKSFAQKLEERGFQLKRTAKTRGFGGIAVIETGGAPPYWIGQ